MNLAHRLIVAAALCASASTASGQSGTLVLDGTDVKLTISRHLSPNWYLGSQGIYERTLDFPGPSDGATEDGRSTLYGHLYLIGDNVHAGMGAGPSLSLHSTFAESSENRHFYVSLGDTWNVPGTARTDVVLQSWAADWTNHVTHIVLKQDGKVGIGTLAPDYMLQVNGSAAATSFVNLSSRQYKERIEEVGAQERAAMLEKLMSIAIARYSYRKEFGGNGARRIGFIAEEMPREVLSDDGKAVDVYELVTYAIAGMKAQQRKIEELEQIVGTLSAQRADE